MNRRFEIGEEIGSGGFSVVHLGIDQITGVRVAVKFEWTKAIKAGRLPSEAKLYNVLAGSQDVPKMYWIGCEDGYNILVLELLGPSLFNLLAAHNTKFSLKTMLMLLEQMVHRIEYVHSRGIIHRDIKLGNFLMGLGRNDRNLYIVDFGISKRYLSKKTGDHIPAGKKKVYPGTRGYMSVNVHNGARPSRRDDLISAGYAALHLITTLPWKGIEEENKQLKLEMISECKRTTSHQDLCKDLPEDFVKYFEHCYSLGYDSTPDYQYLIQLINKIFVHEGFVDDKVFDWVVSDFSPQSLPDPAGSLPDPARSLSHKKSRGFHIQWTASTCCAIS